MGVKAEALRDNLDANGKYIVRIWNDGLAMRALAGLEKPAAQRIAKEINKNLHDSIRKIH